MKKKYEKPLIDYMDLTLIITDEHYANPSVTETGTVEDEGGEEEYG